MRRFFIIMMVVAQLLWLFAGRAGAAPITLNYLNTYAGNDCAGVFGQPFAACVTPVEYGESPIIAKWTPGDTWELNTDVFPSLSSSLFNVTLNDDRTGHFTYYGGGPNISYVVVKAGNYVNLYSTGTPGPLEFDFDTIRPEGKALGVSHVSVYDTAQPVPEPGSMSMFGIGMLAIARGIRKGWAKR